MAETLPQGPANSCRTICLPVAEEDYEQIVQDSKRFRQWLDQAFQQTPELFPEAFAQGYAMKDSRTSRKLECVVRRIQLRDGSAWSVRPSFVLPGIHGRHAIRENLILRESYNRSYGRPRLEELSRGRWIDDDGNIEDGNPNLTPAVSHRISPCTRAGALTTSR